MRRLLLLAAVLALVPRPAAAQPDAAQPAADAFSLDVPAPDAGGAPVAQGDGETADLALTGALRADLLAMEGDAPDAPGGAFGGDGRRNPALAFGLSAAVPGLGQAYNGSWVRAAVAAGLEVGLWVGYASWRSNGLDGRDAYQAFAHRDWSPVRYAAWLNEYPGYSGPDLDVSGLGDVDFGNPAAWSPEQRARVLGLFEAIREAERATRYRNGDGTGNGAAFSHLLEDFGEQQYYELIGKYYQYGPGWSDWQRLDPSDPRYYTLETPADRAAFEAKTALFFEYAADHAAANTLLRRASRALSFVALNHALSAFDAALTARFHNRGLDVRSSMALAPDGLGGAVPTAQLTLTF